jgi:hypothetical protein
MAEEARKPRRQRAILSCNDCRRRKLRCDRLDPCNRCIKGGIMASCAYSPGAHGTPSESSREVARKRKSRRQTSNVAESLYESDGELSVFESTEPNPSREPRKQPEKLRSTQLRSTQLRRDEQIDEPEIRDQVEFLGNSPDLKGLNHTSAAMGMLTGRNYGTQLFGTSSVMSVIAHVKASLSVICDSTDAGSFLTSDHT